MLNEDHHDFRQRIFHRYKTFKAFLHTKPSRLFFKASVPGAVGMIASNIYFSLEMLLIGRLIGQSAFAAGNLALPLILINFALADMIAVGSAVRIAIRLGEGRNDEANKVFTTAVFTAVILSALTSFVLIAAAPLLFSLMGASYHLLDDAVLYLRVYSVFTPLTCLVFVFDNYLRICGKVRFSMVMNLVMSFLCLFFEFLFLYVFDRGIGYAALGTSLGMSITCIICILPFLKGNLALRFVRLKPSLSILRDLFAQGFPSFLNNIRKDRVRKIALYCVMAIALMCLAFTILLEIFPGQIFSLFLESDEAGLSLAIHAISIMGLTYIVRWISYACQSFSSAVGKNREATVLSLCNALVFPLLMMFVLQNFQLDGIWFVTPSAALLTAITAVVIYFVQIRKLVKD